MSNKKGPGKKGTPRSAKGRRQLAVGKSGAAATGLLLAAAALHETSASSATALGNGAAADDLAVPAQPDVRDPGQENAGPAPTALSADPLSAAVEAGAVEADLAQLQISEADAYALAQAIEEATAAGDIAAVHGDEFNDQGFDLSAEEQAAEAEASINPDSLLLAQAKTAEDAPKADAESGGTGDAAKAKTADKPAAGEEGQAATGAEPVDPSAVSAAGGGPAGFAVAPLLGGALAAAALSGGGGGGGGASAVVGPIGSVLPVVPVVAVVTSATKGKVVDGPVKKATVFYDDNNNGKLDAVNYDIDKDGDVDANDLEASTQTDDAGNYTLTGYRTSAVGKIAVLAGGIDTFTGKAVGFLSAREGADGTTVVTPLTYLLATTNLTQAELKAALGLTGLDIDLEKYDPFAAMQNGTAAEKALGEKVFLAGQQIQTILAAVTAQSTVSGGAGADSVSLQSAVSQSIAAAIKNIAAQPAGSQTSTSALNTITTFAVAGANGVDVQALQGSSNALASITTQLSGNTAANGILGAIKSVNTGIATAYTDLSAKLASGGAALADAQAIASLSQTVLLSSVTTVAQGGSTLGLETLSSSGGLQQLTNSVSQQIQLGGTDTEVPGLFKLSYAEFIGPFAFGSAFRDFDAVMVADSDANIGEVIRSLDRGVPYNLDLLQSLDGTLDIGVGDVFAMVEHNVSFAGGQTVTLILEDLYPLDLQSSYLKSLITLQQLGVTAIVGVPQIELLLGDGTLSPNGIPTFSAAADVTLDISTAQAAQVAGLAAELKAAGIDHISAVGGSLTVTAAQAHLLHQSGLNFLNPVLSPPPSDGQGQLNGGFYHQTDPLVTVTTPDQVALNELLSDIGAAASAGTHLGVDVIDMSADLASITETQAGTLIQEGIQFASTDDVTLQAEGTQLSTSLKDLQKLGVNTVLIDGVATAAADHGHDAVLALGTGGALSASGIPNFAQSANVALAITNTQASEVVALVTELRDAGIDQIGGVGGTLTVSGSNAHALVNGGLSFAADSVVTAVANDSGLSTLVTDIATHAGLGVDVIDVFDNTATITETQAVSLIDAGIHFAAEDSITLQAEGTSLSTSLKDLQKLGVNTVMIDGVAAAAADGHDAVLALGTGTLSPTNIPQFAASADVEVKVTETQVHEVATLAAELQQAGIDSIGSDAPLAVSGSDLNAIVDNGLVFAAEADVTGSLSDASLTDLVHDVDVAAAQNVDLGIDHIDMLDDNASITEAQAVSLIHAGIDFAAADTVDMQVAGTHASTTLKDLHDLGVDHINVDAAAAAANPGHDLLIGLGDVAAGADPAAELLSFLETYKGAPVFAQSADVALEVTQQVYAAIEAAPVPIHDDIVTALVNLGVDEVKVIGTDTEHDLHNP